ncbi:MULTISPECIES: hypothetical protein [Fischerella]|uniref:hypothetical protein n=1 Tax=Fischerella TaxID=1190 RepID=UPI00138AB3A0|nr:MULTISPECIES: hypothetical protein [Fischerella]
MEQLKVERRRVPTRVAIALFDISIFVDRLLVLFYTLVCKYFSYHLLALCLNLNISGC